MTGWVRSARRSSCSRARQRRRRPRDDLIAWSRERMAGFKVPRYVEFLDELPLNATGKVMKDQLINR